MFRPGVSGIQAFKKDQAKGEETECKRKCKIIKGNKNHS